MKTKSIRKRHELFILGSQIKYLTLTILAVVVMIVLVIVIAFLFNGILT